MQLAGSLSKPATVTVGGNPAVVDASNHFTAFAPVVNGTNNIPIIAKDFSGNTTSNSIQVTEPVGTVGGIPTYDILGNMTNNGAGQTYEWDAKNELTAINYSGAAIQNNIIRSEFAYDGRGRRVKIAEKNASGTVLSVKQHLWIGNAIAEERDASDTVQKRFYAEGVSIGATLYFYTRDHLGSIRELVSSTGTIQARYDYDPYSRVTLIQGTNLADFQYAGYYEHQTSGLNLTKFRAYDPNTGKWINRDPMAEEGGINLYDYCGNDPIGVFDETGLDPNGFAPAVNDYFTSQGYPFGPDQIWAPSGLPGIRSAEKIEVQQANLAASGNTQAAIALGNQLRQAGTMGSLGKSGTNAFIDYWENSSDSYVLGLGIEIPLTGAGFLEGLAAGDAEAGFLLPFYQSEVLRQEAISQYGNNLMMQAELYADGPPLLTKLIFNCMGQ